MKKTIEKSKVSKFYSVLYCLMLLPALYYSQKFTDPFFTAKHIGGMYIAGVVFIFITIHYLKNKYEKTYSLNLLDLSVLFFIFAIIIRYSLSGEWFWNSINLLNILACTIAYFLFLPLIKNSVESSSKINLNAVFIFITILAIVQSLYGIFQYFDFVPRLQNQFKTGGAFGNPGPYSNFLVCLLPVTLFQSILQKRSFSRNLNILASCLLVTAVVLTKARTAWIASAFIILMSVYLFPKCKELIQGMLSDKIKRFVVILIVLVLIVLSVIGLLCFKQDSASGRLFIWKVSAEMIKDKPITGHEFDSFAPVHNRYQAEYFRENPGDNKNAYIADNVTFAFNEFIQIASELGITGLLCFVFIFFMAFYFYFKSKNKDVVSHIGAGIVIAFLVSSLFSYPLKSISTTYIWFIGLTFISSSVHKDLYSLKVPALTKNALACFGIVVFVVWIAVVNNRRKAEFKWKEAYSDARKTKGRNLAKRYKDLEKTLYYNPYFSFNYGAELTVMGDYKNGIRILEQTKSRLCDADLMIYLGAAYEESGNIKKAIQHFEQASYMMPVKFLPKYKLVFLYDSIGEKEKALALAKKILTMPVKVESSIVSGIRAEIQQFINSSNE